MENTTHKNHRCYAQELGGCSKKISREHYFSKSLQLKISESPQVAGLVFQEPLTLNKFGTESLTAKILCKTHNSMLSPLDTEATRFFSTLRDFDQDLSDNAQSVTSEVEIDGAKVERWMLKLLAGVTYGGVTRAAVLRRDAPWLRILFDLEEWPPDWGFYLVASDETFYAFDGIEVTTYVEEDAVLGAEVGLAGFKFALLLGKPGGAPHFRYRPSELIMRRSDRDAFKRLTLNWPSGAKTGYVEFLRGGDYEGDRPQDRKFKEI